MNYHFLVRTLSLEISEHDSDEYECNYVRYESEPNWSWTIINIAENLFLIPVKTLSRRLENIVIPGYGTPEKASWPTVSSHISGSSPTMRILYPIIGPYRNSPFSIIPWRLTWSHNNGKNSCSVLHCVCSRPVLRGAHSGYVRPQQDGSTLTRSS